ncbi:hypothetical protein BDV98DRAFT_193790 [Pterulicium gracile]|uniref:MYND-type domain-containing protein n=1 Tax=Pterulicium gracile TaxID=1884261 RepID=A0A5C3QCH2_9AGAR|nr:hypothetical protein BDV98DRAFT_193790 [Pterula gracilis]
MVLQHVHQGRLTLLDKQCLYFFVGNCSHMWQHPRMKHFATSPLCIGMASPNTGKFRDRRATRGCSCLRCSASYKHPPLSPAETIAAVYILTLVYAPRGCRNTLCRRLPPDCKRSHDLSTGCRILSYCSQECQKKTWSAQSVSHKAVCKALGRFVTLFGSSKAETRRRIEEWNPDPTPNAADVASCLSTSNMMML